MNNRYNYDRSNKNKVLNNAKSTSVDTQTNKKVSKTNTVLQQTSTDPKTSNAEKIFLNS